MWADLVKLEMKFLLYLMYVCTSVQYLQCICIFKIYINYHKGWIVLCILVYVYTCPNSLHQSKSSSHIIRCLVKCVYVYQCYLKTCWALLYLIFYVYATLSYNFIGAIFGTYLRDQKPYKSTCTVTAILVLCIKH